MLSQNPITVSTSVIVFGWSVGAARIRQVLAGAVEPHAGGKRPMPAVRINKAAHRLGEGRREGGHRRQERTGVSGAADTKDLLSCPPCLRGQSPPSGEEPSDQVSLGAVCLWVHVCTYLRQRSDPSR